MAATLLPDDPHDRRLLEQVRPANWVNPVPKPMYDLIVLGAGAGGLVCAAGAAALGARVALIEKHLLGGECLNDGCVPSKALLRSARAVADIRRAGAVGVRADYFTVDFAAVMERIRRVRADLAPHDSAQRLRELGVDVFLGEGQFVDRRAIQVGDHRLSFRKAVVATGSRPAMPNIPGLVESQVLTNETVFALTKLPSKLSIMGAGATGCELAQAFARLGSHVTLFAKDGRVLPKEDSDAANLVAASLKSDGVSLLAASIKQIDPASHTIHHAGGETQFDQLLVATGRVPTVHGLGLEAAGIAFDPNAGIIVNDRLRTTNRRVFAVGDVATNQRFTHVADAMARIVLQNALVGLRRRFSRVVVPRCIYTEPQLAAVGMSEYAARNAGIDYRVIHLPFTDVDRAVLDGDSSGFAKVLVRERSDRIIGATLVGPRAGELIGEVALAMTMKAGLRSFARTVHPYPTFGDALRQIGDTYNRTRLSPFVRRVLRWWIQL